MMKISGTKEWATSTCNIQTGCSHGCLYCYARYNAVDRFHQCADWSKEVIRWDDVKKTRKKVQGRIMFPSTHDITPANLGPCIHVLRNLLEAGNDVLIVTKPHLECVKAICAAFAATVANDKGAIVWRFTIGTQCNDVSQLWEPNAPLPRERWDALKCAFEAGYRTSVSIEPMLSPWNIDELVAWLYEFVTDTIWIGKLNKPESRIVVLNREIEDAAENLIEAQADDKIKAIYERLKDNPKVRWKESIKEVVGLPLETEAGERSATARAAEVKENKSAKILNSIFI